MRTPSLRILLTCLALAGLFTGCRDKPQNAVKPKIHLRTGIQDEGKTLDPTLSYDAAGIEVVRNLFEGLVRYDQCTLKPIPGMAEKWEASPDGRVYTFFIRPGAQWSNGDPLTAHDFEYAWRRLADLRTGAKFGNLFHDMGMDGADAYHAVFTEYSALEDQRAAAQQTAEDTKKSAREREAATASATALKAKMAPLLARLDKLIPTLGFRAPAANRFEVRLKDRVYGRIFLAYVGFEPLHPVHRATVEQYGPKWTQPAHMVSNGPYVLTEHVLNSHYRYERNPRYWGAASVQIDRVTVAISTDSEVHLRSYQSTNPSDTLDWLGTHVQIPADRLADWKDKSDYRAATVLMTYFTLYNLRRPPFDDVRVREALCLAVEREVLTDKVVKGGQAPATGFFPPIDGEYTPEAAIALEDPARARALLAQAGYTIKERPLSNPVGTDYVPVVQYEAIGFPSVTYLFNTSPRHEAVAVALQAMWKQHLGIKVELANQEWPAVLNARDTGNFFVVRAGWQADIPDVSSFATTLLPDSEHNEGKWVSATYEGLVRRARESEDQAERERLYREAERQILTEFPVCPLFFDANPGLVKLHVKGYCPNALNYHPIAQLRIER